MSRTLENIFDIGNMMKNRLWSRQQAAHERSEHETKQRAQDFIAATPYIKGLREWVEGERSRILRAAKAEDLVELKAYQRVLDKVDADRRESERVING